jgi:AraC-like DNA-binding protein
MGLIVHAMTESATKAPKQREYLLRSAGLDGFAPLMRELGIDPHIMLQRFGIDPAVLDDPDVMVPYTAFLAVLDAAAQETGLPHFGLILAERQQLPMLGPLGFTMKQAPDLRTAIEELIAYLHLHVQGARSHLSVVGDTAMWSYEVFVSDIPGISEQEDLAVAIGIDIMRELVGRDWNPDFVTLVRKAPFNSAPYRRVFRCPVHFEAEHNQSVFDARLLDRKLTGGDSRLHAILNSHLRNLDASGGADFGSEVQQIILQAMKNGNCSLPRVASYLGMTPRTLQRRLSTEGTSFQAELDAVRSRVAHRYLEETAMPLTSLADMLGYSDLAAFSRAFKKINSVSPLRWRGGERSIP